MNRYLILVGSLAVSGCVDPVDLVSDDGQGTDTTQTDERGDGDSGDGDSGDGDGDGDSGDGDGDGDTGDGDGDGDTGDGDGDGDGDPDPRQVELETYAPRVWFPANEIYWPSSVEFAFPELERFIDGEGKHSVRSIASLDSPSDTLPFFAGELDTAPVYAFWADKGGDVVDLVYFFYYPYNRGKSVADTIWGNHVGDWEHITVRLLGNADEGYTPSQVYLSAHSFGGAYDWDSGEVELFEGTHPVVYSAWGSHGLWAGPGDHVYQSIGETFFDVCVTLICADLTDQTSAGVAWDTWTNMVALDYGGQAGIGGAQWPVWMSDQFTDAGAGDPAVPGMGPIYRWGNEEDCSVLGIPIDITDLIGVCRLENGPTGPVSKGVWGPELE
ncbi:hypothetical protein ENSA5_54960 [Enhygromyxa salina]|uniref:Uncharacterized protein n=1 Tax=Enhygromyxa salina TaxID=215803 RepID=A0A2S9XET8_9BACT|nr:Vps62-related protein [Enhygromyxa salina]PRP91379.1 hypothetical protein ENSA5_54960 [Enhygromyxa salina]